MKERLLVFVPGYNVSRTIGRAIQNLIKLRKKLEFDVIYVDNCSSDTSAEIVSKIVKNTQSKFIKSIINKKNLGYGGSQRVAFKYAFEKNYGFLMEYDGDLQYPYEAIPLIFDKIKAKNSSLVFGSRVTKDEHCKDMGLLKKTGNKILNRLNNWAFNFKVSEIHTGFRIYNLNLLKRIDLTDCHTDYRWSLDSVLAVYKINKNFSEISIQGYYDKDKSSPSFKELWKYTSYMVMRAFKYKLFRK